MLDAKFCAPGCDKLSQELDPAFTKRVSEKAVKAISYSKKSFPDRVVIVLQAETTCFKIEINVCSREDILVALNCFWKRACNICCDAFEWLAGR